jgi:hypothetical protein
MIVVLFGHNLHRRRNVSSIAAVPSPIARISGLVLTVDNTLAAYMMHINAPPALTAQQTT